MPKSLDNYPLARTSGETRRLGLQASLYAEHTDALLAKAGIRQGMRVLDVGCGPGHVTLQIARMVGTEGSVVMRRACRCWPPSRPGSPAYSRSLWGLAPVGCFRD